MGMEKCLMIGQPRRFDVGTEVIKGFDEWKYVRNITLDTDQITNIHRAVSATFYSTSFFSL